jgi:glycosyltransferase involved in cell wall biosynthesis
VTAEPVSILIPAYNERFFGEALQSALAQRHPDFEIVICDDSPGTAIERHAMQAASPRIRYLRNPSRRGFGGNFTECLAQARADLVKFLNDDDRLDPDCIASLAGIMGANPSIALATSRRRVIDEHGGELPPIAATAPVSHVSALMLGRELGDLALAHALNVIGEPTTVMFRKSRVPVDPAGIFVWGGVNYHCLADLSLWLRLLATGFAYYHASALSDFRMHPGQEQQGESIRVDALDEWLALMRQARGAGFLSTDAAWGQAMRALRARILYGGPLDRYGPPVRSRLERVLAEVDAELSRAHA